MNYILVGCPCFVTQYQKLIRGFQPLMSFFQYPVDRDSFGVRLANEFLHDVAYR